MSVPEIVGLIKRVGLGKVNTMSNGNNLFVCHHPNLPLVLLCYDNLKSANNLLTSQCRGLILEKETWRVVCWGMDRFSESLRDAHTQSKNQTFDVELKEDGSLLFFFFYKGSWRLSTRHTFCDQESERKYLEGFSSVCKQVVSSWFTVDENETWENLSLMFAKKLNLEETFTYCFELCSPQTRIVRAYKQPTLFLLSAHSNLTHKELPSEALDMIVKFANDDRCLQRPKKVASFKIPKKSFDFLSLIKQVENDLMFEWEQTEQLFEGFILKLNGNCVSRFKVKSATYKVAHKLRYRGWVTATPDTLFPLVCKQQTFVLDMLREIRHDFPEFAKRW